MSSTGEAIKEFFKQDLFYSMSVWAFILLVVSVLVLLLIIVLYIRLRQRQRKIEWSNVLNDEKQRKRYAVEKDPKRRPEPKTLNGIENIGYERSEAEKKDDVLIYTQPIKTSVRDAHIVKEALPLVGERNSAALYTHPYNISDNYKDVTGDVTVCDEDDDELSALYAQPFQTFKPIVKPNREDNNPENATENKNVVKKSSENEGQHESVVGDPEVNDVKHVLGDPEVNEMQHESDDPEVNDVEHESAPGDPEVLYAKSFKRSSRILQKDDDENINNPNSSSNVEARKESQDTENIGNSNIDFEKYPEKEDDYAEIDLAAIAKAEMSTGDDVELTEL